MTGGIDWQPLLPLVAPLIALQLILMAVALYDLAKRQHVLGGNKLVWALVILLVNMIGPVAYLLLGRKEE
jgi:CBS-domain-containing membrane protein